ncbi:MAG: hypothetical protein H6809_04890 [Phycisphaeraceae bacterium]|nr:hypothetical protein [Phycisphaeraceae bacterium]
MPTYKVTGAHRETAEDVELTLDAPDLAAASRLANDSGVVVAVVTELGASSRPPEPESEAAQRERMLELLRTIASNTRPPQRAPESEAADVALALCTLVCPVVGIISGSIRLAHRDASGAGCVALAILAILLWGFALFMFGAILR